MLYASLSVCRLKDLQASCSDSMGAYAKCMDYYSSEFEMCRKQQAAFEKACPVPPSS